MADGLREPLTQNVVHLCIDMQRIFSPEGPWPTPWMPRVLPVVVALVQHRPERTVFTRFITPKSADEMPGRWRAYYENWRQTTREHLAPEMLELLPALAQFAPPAAVFDKMVYSAFATADLHVFLRERHVDTLIVTGSETDVCVLATVLGAVDLGYRVILVRDAVCSSSDAGHDALLQVYHRRYGIQIETADADEIVAAWHH